MFCVSRHVTAQKSTLQLVPAALTSLDRGSGHSQRGQSVGLAPPASNPTPSEQGGRPKSVGKRFKVFRK